MFTEVVEIKFGKGESQKSFMVHKGILRFYSAYFEAALNVNFSKIRKGVTQLPEEDVKNFENFVLWLYSGRFCKAGAESFDAICKLWVFGDRFQIPAFENRMIDELRNHCQRTWAVPTNHMQYIYENTTAGSELRRFMIYLTSRYGYPTDLIEDKFSCSLARGRLVVPRESHSD